MEDSHIPDPCFEIGTIRGNSISGDCGVVRGMRYVWNEDLQNWQYQYYIALDFDSPSYEWTKFDWGWQEVWEAVLFSDFQTIERTEEKTRDDQ